MGFAALSSDWSASLNKAPGRRLEIEIEPGEGSKMDEIRIPISADSDVVTARLEGRAWAERAGFKGTDLTVVSAVISEVARYIRKAALPGEIAISICQESGKVGIVVVARTTLSKKVQELFFANRLRQSMDECRVYYKPGETVLTIKKWVNVWAE